MLRNLKLTIEYDGKDFQGWQTQAKGFRTVQDEVEKVFLKIFKQKVHVAASGRTDSGVHARGQVASVKVKTDMTCERIRLALNGTLPEDVSIIKVEDVHAKFHAQYNAVEKTYRYTILNRLSRAALDRNQVYYYPYKLNIRLMREEAKVLVGRKDFKSFQSKDPAKLRDKTTRTIKAVKILKRGDFITMDFTGDGFLYRMVRNIVGTLMEIGAGRRPKGSIKKILSEKNRIFAGKAAKASGLTLLEVKY